VRLIDGKEGAALLARVAGDVERCKTTTTMTTTTTTKMATTIAKKKMVVGEVG